jgi:hypothetical protein
MKLVTVLHLKDLDYQNALELLQEMKMTSKVYFNMAMIYINLKDYPLAVIEALNLITVECI